MVEKMSATEPVQALANIPINCISEYWMRLAFDWSLNPPPSLNFASLASHTFTVDPLSSAIEIR